MALTQFGQSLQAGETLMLLIRVFRQHNQGEFGQGGYFLFHGPVHGGVAHRGLFSIPVDGMGPGRRPDKFF